MNNYYSEWIQMEIEHAKALNKEIECIDLKNDCSCKFKIYKDTNLISKLKEVL